MEVGLGLVNLVERGAESPLLGASPGFGAARHAARLLDAAGKGKGQHGAALA